MELETINKLYLELSQIATAKTQRDLVLEAQLKDSRFVNIIKCLVKDGEEILAIYLVRLVANCGLAVARTYVDEINLKN